MDGKNEEKEEEKSPRLRPCRKWWTRHGHGFCCATLLITSHLVVFGSSSSSCCASRYTQVITRSDEETHSLFLSFFSPPSCLADDDERWDRCTFSLIQRDVAQSWKRSSNRRYIGRSFFLFWARPRATTTTKETETTNTMQIYIISAQVEMYPTLPPCRVCLPVTKDFGKSFTPEIDDIGSSCSSDVQTMWRRRKRKRPERLFLFFFFFFYFARLFIYFVEMKRYQISLLGQEIFNWLYFLFISHVLVWTHSG